MRPTLHFLDIKILTLYRWKQRDIHEKREQRKMRIHELESKLELSKVLNPRIEKIIADVQAGGKERFSSITEQLKVNPSPDKPPGNAPNQPTYDMMIHELMLQVWNAVKESGGSADDPNLTEKLVARLRDALEKQHQDDVRNKKELEAEIKEQSKHITSDDLKDGFDSSVGVFLAARWIIIHPIPESFSQSFTGSHCNDQTLGAEKRESRND